MMRLALLLLALGTLATPPARADFPATCVLDDFDRPDGGPPPSGAWVATTGLPGQIGVVVEDGRAVGANTDDSHSASWRTLYAPDQEVHVRYAANPGSAAGSGLGLRLQDPASRFTPMYQTFWYARVGSDDDEVTIWKRSLGPGGQPIDVCLACFVPLGADLGLGDQIGMRAVGSRIEAYLNGRLVASAVDADEPLLEPGYLNLYIGDDVGHEFDDFGGGPVPGFACCNAADDDGDGRIDWPDDGDCASPGSNAEAGGAGGPPDDGGGGEEPPDGGVGEDPAGDDTRECSLRDRLRRRCDRDGSAPDEPADEPEGSGDDADGDTTQPPPEDDRRDERTRPRDRFRDR